MPKSLNFTLTTAMNNSKIIVFMFILGSVTTQEFRYFFTFTSLINSLSNS